MYDVTGLELAVLVGTVVVALTMVGRRTGVSPPVLLLAGGAALSFVPAFADVGVAPEVVVLFFLPALLYWEARTTSLREIRSGLGGVLSSAVVLVLVTATAVAVVGHALGLPWPAAFVLGAVVAPTDATAVGAIAGRLPPRELTTLRAESLVNDGTALTLFAVATAVATGAEEFDAFGATASFVVSYLGGAAVGGLVALAAARIRRLADEPVLRNAVTAMMPFASFLLADLIEGSGVVAVVAYGLVHAQLSPRWIGARTRLQSQAFWSLTAFLLNGSLFVLVGLQLRGAITALPAGERASTAILGALVVVTILVARLLWFLGPALVTVRRSARHPGRLRRRLPLAWAGFRGGVSLAAALAVPTMLLDGAPFPGREAIVVVTAGVIVVTLVLQGLTLPLVLRAARYADDPRPRDEQRLAERRAAEAALDALPAEAARLGAPSAVVERVRAEQEAVLAHDDETTRGHGEREPAGDDDRAIDQEVALRIALVDARRTAVVRLRDDRLVDDLVLMRVQAALDMEEARLRPPGTLS